jgi:DNA-binding protein H-NS
MSMPDTDPPDIPEAIDPWVDAAAPTALTRRERAVVLARIEALMEFWGITVEDLTAPTPDIPAPPPAGPLPIKYRHPVTGDTWDGQGPHPDWLRRALLQEGLRVDELKPAEALPPASEAS